MKKKQPKKHIVQMIRTRPKNNGQHLQPPTRRHTTRDSKREEGRGMDGEGGSERDGEESTGTKTDSIRGLENITIYAAHSHRSYKEVSM